MNLCNNKIKEPVKCNNCGYINQVPYSDYANYMCQIVKDYVEAIGICHKCGKFFSRKRKRKLEEFIRININNFTTNIPL